MSIALAPRLAPKSSLLILSFSLILTMLGVLNSHASDKQSYLINYRVDLSQSDTHAFVRIELGDDSGLSEIDFNLDEHLHHNIKANGELTLKNGRALWQPPTDNPWFSLEVSLNHKRRNGGYDSLRATDFAIFRGDDLIPPAIVRGRKGIESQATLHFTLPSDWPSVNSGWEKTAEGNFIIDNLERRFDRPTGWFIAGKLGPRRERLPTTHIAISGPAGEDIRRMDLMSFVMLNWPTLSQIVGKTPPKIILVMAGDPMWRGGLSGPNSLFVHTARPMVSENGTSTLLHELIHTLTRIRGAKGDDWIAEGLAEYYSYTVLHRAGGLTDDRLARVENWLSNWSKDIKTLRGGASSGERTARAALLFGELDAEIRSRTNGEKSLDNATRAMMQLGKVSLEQLRDIAQELTGKPSEVLASALLDG
ncbi:hypothetical protein [Gilvimarinus polysaccharolyticus]|uniref:hypothetical protein n=1 Tax=Gilvimarinus polysaccharolyticus TaxID=863921 RepID=UPI000AAC9087|nr:hypothetical protein [Gilvimarinus polysaccharolyticus]